MPSILSCKGLSPATARLSSRFHSKSKCNDAVLLPRPGQRPGRFGLFPGRSPLLGESLIYFLFLEVLRCFSSLRWPPPKRWMNVVKTYGLSHSETRGSKVICTYPRIIAAYRVLRRLSEPRHPPCALVYFLVDWPSRFDARPKATNAMGNAWDGRPYFQLCCFEPWKKPRLVEICSLYSFACVNMSKIAAATTLPRTLDLGNECHDSGEYRIRTDDPLLAGQVL